MEPRKGRRAERIAGADRVHDLDRHSRHAQLCVSCCAVCARRSKRDQDQAGTDVQDSLGRRPIVDLRIKPGQILRAGFDDGALEYERAQARPVLRVCRQHRPDVWIQHDQPTRVLAPDR